MQVSIYLDQTTVHKIDQEAKKLNKSRSKIIQSVINHLFSTRTKQGIFDEIFGILDEKAANALLTHIQSSRKNSTRFNS